MLDFNVQNDCTPTYVSAPATIETLSDIQSNPDVSISPTDGSIVIVYEDELLDGNGYGIGCTIMNSDWGVQKTRFLINSETTNNQYNPRVAHFPDGKFLVTWYSVSDYEIHGRVVSSDGMTFSGEITISQDSGDCFYSEISVFDDGTAIVIWTLTSSYLKGRFVYSDGTMSSSEFTLRDSLVSYDLRPSLDVSIDQNSFFAFTNEGMKPYGSQFSKNDGSLVTDFGKLLNNKGYSTGVVSLPNDNFIFSSKVTDGDGILETRFYMGTSFQNTTQTEGNSNNNYQSIVKGRGNVIVAAYTSDSGGSVGNFLLDMYNNQLADDWDVYSSSSCQETSVAAYDNVYSVVWATNNDIYGVKYNFKYPNYISGLDITPKKIDEEFTFDFVFNNPESVGLTYEVKQADGSDLPDWITHSPSSSTQITGTTPAELSECNTQTFEFTVTTSKSCMMTETKNFQIQITDDPITTGAADFEAQTVQVSQSDWNYQFDENCFNDPDNQEITYTSELANGNPLPDWLVFEESTHTFSSPGVDNQCNNTLEVAVQANDHCCNFTRNFDIIVENYQIINNQLLVDQNTAVNSWFEYQFDSNSFADPENIELTYECTLADGSEKPDWITLNSNNRTLNGHTDQTKCDGENIELKIVASDGCNSMSDTFTITFTNQDISVGDSLTDQVKPINTYFEYPFSSDCFSDPENVEITYSATLSDGSPKPDWLDLASSTRTFSGTIPADTICDKFWDLKVTASDGCNSASSNFRITSTNSAPTINKNLDNQTFYVNSQFEFQFDNDCFDDPENAELTYDATLNDGSPLPDWLTFYPSNRTFRGKSLADNCGEVLDIKVTASDPCHSITNNFELTINNPAPILNKQLVRQNAIITLDFEYIFDADTFFNEDGTELTYSASRKGTSDLPSWLQFNSNNRTFSGKPENDLCDSIYEIVVVADDECNTDSGSFYLEVRNRKPVREKDFTDHSIEVFEIIDYTIPEDSFIDPDDQQISLKAELAESDSREWPSWLEFNEKSGRFYGNATSCGEPYVIVVSGADTCLDETSGNWTLTILDDPPQALKPFEDQTFFVNAFNSYQFDNGTFIDPNGHALTYEASLSNGEPLPDWLEFDSANRRFTGTASGCTQTLTVKVTAIDKCTSTISQNFEISLVNNPIYVDEGLVDQEMNGNLIFNYTFTIDAFGDNDGENKNYNYSFEYIEPKDKKPTWLIFQSKNRRFLGNTPNEDLNYKIKVYASDSCGSIKASSTFKIKITEMDYTTSSDNENTSLSAGIISLISILSIIIVLCLVLFIFYRYHLQRKYQKLWDGKGEFFTAKLPEDDLKHSGDSNNSEDSSTSSSSPDLESNSDIELKNTIKQGDETNQLNNTNILNHDILSDIQVSDLSNESDLLKTESSDHSSSSSSSSFSDFYSNH
ncbi:putative ig domain-containing protein [Anaeramoeba flamelloides]|uniref:Ig domain-containing protein n=1 Tax=Anaeramoeba flamelloides TaxID=1746091 RepID=A0ABQ8Z287_9EUKA|nr:putative ig domain-containing protein [Anaeramoeba flamelloides]